ncbi:MAG TPA: VanZ family protein [Chitinophagaceae bacterium]|jgi:glycopeptide antibiotics resistance protein|nr:VanZ family protein [Chitinophagaceae bacterium]
MKKIAVLLPVFVLAIFYFKARYHGEYGVAGLRGKASLAFGVCIMFLVMIVAVYKKKQETFLQGCIQASFLVYVFMVLTLTGYFLLFREVAGHGWWHKVSHRIYTKEKINLHPFLMFKQFQIGSYQVIGNLVMLLPLGIYVPLLFPKLSGFFRVFVICLLVSVSIELMQLITSVRSTDIDDVILNTSGAVVGYLMYRLLRLSVST